MRARERGRVGKSSSPRWSWWCPGKHCLKSSSHTIRLRCACRWCHGRTVRLWPVRAADWLLVQGDVQAERLRPGRLRGASSAAHLCEAHRCPVREALPPQRDLALVQPDLHRRCTCSAGSAPPARSHAPATAIEPPLVGPSARTWSSLSLCSFNPVVLTTRIAPASWIHRVFKTPALSNFDEKSIR